MTDDQVAQLRAIVDRLPQLVEDVRAGRVRPSDVEAIAAVLAEVQAVVRVELEGEASLVRALPHPPARA